MIVWIEAARFSLAKPGLLAGEVSGLDEGDRATIRLMNLGHSHREENGVLVDEWTLGNGPWEQSGLRLSQGTYHLIPEAEGYLLLHIAGGLMFEVPAEGMDWRERDLGFAFFRPKDANDKPLSDGTGWIRERSVRGRIAGMPDGVVATVRIQRVPPIPNEIYVVGPVSNQQKWDTLGAERSGAGWRSGELPEGPVVASSSFGGLSLHLLPAL